MDFLGDCVVSDLNAEIKREAISIRRANRVRLPDAIIAATALSGRMPLMSADRDFARIERLQLLLYEP